MMTIAVGMMVAPGLTGGAVVAPIAPLVPVTLAQLGGLSVAGSAAALAVAVVALCTSRVLQELGARRRPQSTQDVAATIERLSRPALRSMAA
jgi:hypothetical protein